MSKTLTVDSKAGYYRSNRSLVVCSLFSWIIIVLRVISKLLVLGLYSFLIYCILPVDIRPGVNRTRQIRMPNHHCHHNCEHSPNDDELGLQYNLYEKIDKQNVECLNETTEGSGKTVFKPWDKRMDTTDFVESDADEELLFNIPFTGNVKLKAIKILSDDSDAHPSELRLFKNKPHMTFDDIVMQADQVFELQRDHQGVMEYCPKIVTFSSVTHLTMHFPKNFGAERTKIYYIGLKGEWTQGHQHGVTICTYEARPMLDDHKVKNFDSVAKQIE